MLKNNVITFEMALNQILSLAQKTKGWSGADIAGLVRNAVAYCLNRHFDSFDSISGSKHVEQVTAGDINISNDDFSRAYKELVEKSTFLLPVDVDDDFTQDYNISELTDFLKRTIGSQEK